MKDITELSAQMPLVEVLGKVAKKAEVEGRSADAFLFRAAISRIQDLEEYKMAWARLSEEHNILKERYVSKNEASGKDGLEFP